MKLLIRFWKINVIKIRCSLEAWVEHHGGIFTWNVMHKHNIIQYTKLVNTKYFFFWKSALYVRIWTYYVHCVLHDFAYYEVFQVCEMCATPCYICVVDAGVSIGMVKTSKHFLFRWCFALYNKLIFLAIFFVFSVLEMFFPGYVFI